MENYIEESIASGGQLIASLSSTVGAEFFVKKKDDTF